MKVFAPRFYFLMLSIAGWSFLAHADYNTKDLKLKAQETPAQLKDVGIVERLGEQLNLSLEFTNELGQKVRLNDFFHKSRPVILSLVYYGCPSLCNYHLNGLTAGLRQITEKPGKDYEVVAVSFDPKDTPAVAFQKKRAYLGSLGKVGAETSWHFLTGDQQNIAKLAQAVGFKFKWNEVEKQWAHASAAILITPEGKISRYLHGVYFEPRTLSLAMTEASRLKISNIINTFILYCFRYDPQKSKYIVAAANIMKVGGIVIMAVVFLVLFKFWMRQRLLKQGDGSCLG